MESHSYPAGSDRGYDCFLPETAYRRHCVISESRPEKLGNSCLVPLEGSQKPSKKSQYPQMPVLKRLCAGDDSCSQLTTTRGPSWIFCPEEIMKTPTSICPQ
ncbi:hypothetical protein ACRRTK_022832 [Alexandromys fortis]